MGHPFWVIRIRFNCISHLRSLYEYLTRSCDGQIFVEIQKNNQSCYSTVWPSYELTDTHVIAG